MIVRRAKEALSTGRHAVGETWESLRLVLNHDGVGFSFHVTTMHPGTETRLWYKNHYEVVYCMEGQGEIENLEDGTIHPIGPGTVYVLDKHDRHILRAKTELKNACVFSPALYGSEMHDEDGSYPLLESH